MLFKRNRRCRPSQDVRGLFWQSSMSCALTFFPNRQRRQAVSRFSLPLPDPPWHNGVHGHKTRTEEPTPPPPRTPVRSGRRRRRPARARMQEGGSGGGHDDGLEALDAGAVDVRHGQDVERRLVPEHVVAVLVHVVLLPTPPSGRQECVANAQECAGPTTRASRSGKRLEKSDSD